MHSGSGALDQVLERQEGAVKNGEERELVREDRPHLAGLNGW